MKKQLFLIALLISSILTLMITTPMPVQAQTTFKFAAAGDYGSCASGSTCNRVLTNTVSQHPNLNFWVALGDLSYGSQSTSSWCSSFKSVFSNVVVIEGNHDGTSGWGSSCPFPFSGGSGTYFSGQFTFDYPTVNPIARFIFNGPEAPSEAYMGPLITDARARGIPWIITADHYNCMNISNTHSGCEAGLSRQTFMINNGVDLYLVGHNHNYERSKQVPPNCGPTDGGSNNPPPSGCTLIGGNTLDKGAGMVSMTIGTGGQGIYSLRGSCPTTWFQACGADSHGASVFTVTETSIIADFVRSDGALTDTFTIQQPGPPPPPPANVVITDFTYTPQTLTINQGETVTWRNDGPSLHTVTSSTWDSGSIAVGATFSRTFTSSGTFNYFCSFHAQMTGTITVNPGPPPPPPTPFNFVRNPTTSILAGHTEPDVIKVGTTYYLYSRANGHIQVATSTNGLSWSADTSILTASGSGWDAGEVIAPSVYVESGTYYLYYEADAAGFPGQRKIGVATSTNPTGPFTKYSGNPVLSASGGWEGGIVGTPVVTKVGTRYYMFYHGFNGANDQGGIAYANNPLGPWTREPNNPTLPVGSAGKWDDVKTAPSAVWVNSGLIWVIYEGFDGTNWRVGAASSTIDSTDLRIKSQTKFTDPILNLGTGGTFDDATVQIPGIIQVGTELWMYYSGHDGASFSLGRAISPITVPPPTLTGDLNGDCVVNTLDLTILALNFGASGTNVADINRDGTVNTLDLTVLALNFEARC